MVWPRSGQAPGPVRAVDLQASAAAGLTEHQAAVDSAADQAAVLPVVPAASTVAEDSPAAGTAGQRAAEAVVSCAYCRGSGTVNGAV